ncbi:hypothetical protein [Mesorhizobium comanense]|uniref:hypothetical protein n=1 Tax=Mesorhizobium comanense TaxID=2502215 RepID=UPI0010F75B31|nr:hypothetical protein [Mesorhizobium comanense]
MSEPNLLAQAEPRARKGEHGLRHRGSGLRNLTIAASFLTLAAVAAPLLLPQPADTDHSSAAPPSHTVSSPAQPGPANAHGDPSQDTTVPAAQTQAAAPDQPAGTIPVSPGVLVKINRHNRFSQGQDWPIAITIISPPTHGTVSIQDGTAPITYHDGVMRMSAVKQVFYKSDPGYTGVDTFTYKRVSEDEADPLNARTYTMTVYVK